MSKNNNIKNKVYGSRSVDNDLPVYHISRLPVGLTFIGILVCSIAFMLMMIGIEEMTIFNITLGVIGLLILFAGVLLGTLQENDIDKWSNRQ